jgi:serine/threonine protein kinase
MAENSAGSPVFADRYRFQTVGHDWDRGRSGFTHLVFDIKRERLGVIKRAELKSQQALEELKNEVSALLDLKGLGVPEVYDTGEAEHGSKKYFYVVLEYIEGIRIEKNLASLSTSERAEILTQFFSLLANSHRLGIINGDIDLKHLFWRRDKSQLIVIDWGNAKLDVDPKKKNEFAYDMARSAEIIYSLVTLKGHPSATGSIALPPEASLVSGLAPLPIEFRNLCKWAPRTPNEGAQSPHTAQELFEASKAWQKAVKSAKPYTPRRRPNWGTRLLFVFIIIAAIFLGVSPNSPLYPYIYPGTSTPTVTASNTLSPTASETIVLPSETLLSTVELINTVTVTPSQTATIISTLTPTTIPLPRTYTELSPAFDKISSPETCWTNETTSPLGIRSSEGFSRRSDQYWRFGVEKDQAIENPLEVDFGSCFGEQKFTALALNVWVSRLELERNSTDNPVPGKEFGIFIEDINDQRREYTIWIDKDNLMHLRVRENNLEISNDVVLIVNKNKLKIMGTFPRVYAVFPIQMFFEINNQGWDLIYLGEGPLQLPVTTEQINPSQMTRIDKAIYSTLGDIQAIGLIGYGGETQTVIWPLVFFGE